MKKKRRIKYPKKFIRTMFILLVTMVLIITTILFANYLKLNGLDSIFTVRNCKAAFEKTEYIDFIIIDLCMIFTRIMVMISAISILLEHEKNEKHSVRKDVKM